MSPWLAMLFASTTLCSADCAPVLAVNSSLRQFLAAGWIISTLCLEGACLCAYQVCVHINVRVVCTSNATATYSERCDTWRVLQECDPSEEQFPPKESCGYVLLSFVCNALPTWLGLARTIYITYCYIIYTVYIKRCVWQGNHQIYCVYARFWPTLHMVSFNGSRMHYTNRLARPSFANRLLNEQHCSFWTPWHNTCVAACSRQTCGLPTFVPHSMLNNSPLTPSLGCQIESLSHKM